MCRLSDQFKYPDTVRDTSLNLLGKPEFAHTIKTNAVVPETVSKFGKAYIILRSVHEAEEEGRGGEASASAVVDHSAHISRVNMASLDVDGMVANMRVAILNAGVGQGHGDGEGDDDGSFY